MDEPGRDRKPFMEAPQPLTDEQSRELTELLRRAREGSFDELTSEAQAVVRAHWDQQIAEDITSLNLTAELRASGKPFYTADAAGNVIEHGAQRWRSPPRVP